MKTFKVKYKEVVEYEFYVDVETEEEVEEKFFELVEEGNFDFSDGYVSEGYVTEIKEV